MKMVRYPKKIIQRVQELYTEGKEMDEIKDIVKCEFNVKPDKRTIMNWINKYVGVKSIMETTQILEKIAENPNSEESLRLLSQPLIINIIGKYNQLLNILPNEPKSARILKDITDGLRNLTYVQEKIYGKAKQMRRGEIPIITEEDEEL